MQRYQKEMGRKNRFHTVKRWENRTILFVTSLFCCRKEYMVSFMKVHRNARTMEQTNEFIPIELNCLTINCSIHYSTN